MEKRIRRLLRLAVATPSPPVRLPTGFMDVVNSKYQNKESRKLNGNCQSQLKKKVNK